MQRLSNFIYWLRKLFNIATLIAIGYLLGNTFPTFEVKALSDHALPSVTVSKEGCAPLCEDFNDTLTIGE